MRRKILGLAVSALCCTMVVAADDEGSLVSFAMYSLTQETSTDCGQLSWYETYQNHNRYDTYGMYICPGGNPQGNYDHEVVDIAGGGQCNSYAGSRCDPEFGAPETGTDSTPYWRHWIKFSVQNREALYFPFVFPCVTATTTNTTRTINGVVWSTDPECPPEDPCGFGCPSPPTCQEWEPIGFDDCGCPTCQPSPIVVNVQGNPIAFSSPGDGVSFDMYGAGRTIKIAWPIANGTAWLAMDRNGNRVIDNGTELFGNTRTLARGDRAVHGYEALAELDANGDEVVDTSDPLFSRLVLWEDRNRDGRSQPEELVRVADAGITGFSVRAHEARATDEWGNQFRYRAPAYFSSEPRHRFSWDVFPAMASTNGGDGNRPHP